MLLTCALQNEFQSFRSPKLEKIEKIKKGQILILIEIIQIICQNEAVIINIPENLHKNLKSRENSNCDFDKIGLKDRVSWHKKVIDDF